MGVPQVSVLGPLSCNIYMCDLFLFMSESNVTNYEDDTTLYACEKNLYDVQRKWTSYGDEVAKKVIIWIFNTIWVVPW